MNEAEVREKLRKVEALFARAGPSGERNAAAAAADRIRAKLHEASETASPVEMRFSRGDTWSRQLFVALYPRPTACASRCTPLGYTGPWSYLAPRRTS